MSALERVRQIRSLLDGLEADLRGEGGRMSPARFCAEHMPRAPRCLPYTRPSEDGPDVWDVLREADGSGDTITLLYSGYRVPPGERDAEYASGWTREHAWPRSRGGMTTGRPGMGTDAHNLFAADASVNSARSNKPFADLGGGGSEVVDRSPAPGHTGRTLARATASRWEPPDRCKGAVARAALYMACRYHDRLRLTDDPGEAEGAPGCFGMLGDLLAWNRRFPPCAWERARNDAVERAQGNRNPFVDHPGLADLVRFG